MMSNIKHHNKILTRVFLYLPKEEHQAPSECLQERPNSSIPQACQNNIFTLLKALLLNLFALTFTLSRLCRSLFIESLQHV